MQHSFRSISTLADWIHILECPLSGEPLREMSVAEINALEDLLTNGSLSFRTGNKLPGLYNRLLTTESGDYRYPVVDDIYFLLPEFAIVGNRNLIVKEPLSKDKQWVKDFYDRKGWFTDTAGNYEDAVIYEDLREVSAAYIKKCHERVSRHLPPSGRFMLDAASGPVQYDDYLQYSSKFDYRVCVDFSFQALLEAKKKLGEKGICILSDISRLPLRDGSMDGFVSLNTIYHIPRDEQVAAINQLYRVLAPGGSGVVVYDWYKHSRWMNASLLPFRAFVYLKNRLWKMVSRMGVKKAPAARLYFYAHKPAYFQEHLPPFQLKVWRTVSVPFMRYYIHSWLFGRQILEWIFKKEEANPQRCGLYGEYPMFVFNKN